MAPDDWLEVLRLDHLQRMAGRISRLEHMLEATGGEPQFWAEDARRYMGALRERFARPAGALPVDLLGDRDPSQGAAAAARLTREFGRLLYWWPGIVEGALKLRGEGVRLSRAQ